MTDNQSTEPAAKPTSLLSDDAQWSKSATERLMAAAAEERAAEEAKAEATETPAAPAAPPPKTSPKPKPKPESAPAAAKEADGEKLTVRERVALREHKEALEAQAQQLRAALVQQFNAAAGTLAQREARTAALEHAAEQGDHDGMAQILGHKDWNAFQNHLIGTLASPGYKETRALQRQVAQERAEREAERQRGVLAQQQAAAAANMRQLAKDLAESEDPICRAHADDPQFIDAIYSIQKEYWDGRTTIRPEKALRAKRRAGPPLIEQLDALADRHTRGRSGGTTSSAASPKSKATAPLQASKPKSFDALADGRAHQRKETDWLKRSIAKLQESMD